MELRYINSELLLQAWLAGVENILFPSALVEELKPHNLVDGLENLQATRESMRNDVDVYISEILALDTPEELWTKLRQTDPMLVALYFDRIEVACLALERTLKDMPVVEIPESWDTTVRFLLFQKLFQ